MKLQALLTAVSVLAVANTQGSNFTVTTTNDSGPGSLRQAILDANASADDDRVTFTVTGTITLASALPAITDTNNTSIVGPGTNLLTVSGNNTVQIFTVNAQAAATISGLTIANGRATNYAHGAGIANAGKLTISTCALVNNETFGGWGGAVFNSGTLAVMNSVFSGNQVTGENGFGSSFNTAGGGGGAGLGGALFSLAGSVTISSCSFSSNSATGGNGGDAPNGSGNGCGGGVQHGCACGNGGYGSGGGGAFANQCHGGNGGFGGGGGGAAGQPEPAGGGGFGAGGGGNFSDYCAGGGGAGLNPAAPRRACRAGEAAGNRTPTEVRPVGLAPASLSWTVWRPWAKLVPVRAGGGDPSPIGVSASASKAAPKAKGKGADPGTG